jgi:hypothetical protein
MYEHMRVVPVARLIAIGVRWFVVGLAAGATAMQVGSMQYAARDPAPVKIGSPVVERSAPDYSVIRIPFEQRGAEAFCHLVLDHTRAGWTLRC